MESIIIDDLREINSSHTTVRRLDVISQFVKKIGTRKVPKEILKKELIRWNIDLEKINEDYANKKGKLAEGNRPTSAFDKYVKIIEEMGLATSLGHTMSLTRIGNVLFQFIDFKAEFDYTLIYPERLFYLYLLLSKDADYFLLAADIIASADNKINQSDSQKKFVNDIEIRLNEKRNFSTSQAKLKISEKLRVVKYDWQRAEVYSEHILAPRYEWLVDLGVLDTYKEKSSTYYKISQRGSMFLTCIPIVNETIIHDINQKWLNNLFFQSTLSLYQNDKVTEWSDCTLEIQEKYLGEVLLKSYKLFSGGKALRIALNPFLIYSAIYLLSEENLKVELTDLMNRLENSFTFENRTYKLFNAARINEGYISINFKEE
ncbi:hypothetical protein [Confluentibacter sediminis]|uniref:hypothetical protein n=1 Tax=Confluentibacter sediminis TaxID=2219045 RepID=UPI000DAED1F9|nr:hypothetical protein [Confluentibacter sediminis]